MNTPRGDLGSPAQRLYSRILRSLVPTTLTSLLSQKQTDVSKALRAERLKKASYSNRGASQITHLSEGQRVVTRTDPKSEWKPATIENKIHLRSYILRDEFGHKYRRNSSNIKPTSALIPTPSNYTASPDEHDLNQSQSTSTSNLPYPPNKPIYIENNSKNHNIDNNLQSIPNLQPRPLQLN